MLHQMNYLKDQHELIINYFLLNYIMLICKKAIQGLMNFMINLIHEL